MYASIRRIIFLLLALSVAPLSRVSVRAEEEVNDDDQMDEQADDNVDDDHQDDDDYVGGAQAADWETYEWEGGNYVQYWTEFAVYPQRCIV